MAFPIRFKLINKETGEVIKGNKPGTRHMPNGLCSVVLLPDGTPAFWSSDGGWHEMVRTVSCKEYELWVAIDKVDGKWNYIQVGF